MKKKLFEKKKLLSILIAACILASMVPVSLLTAFAADATTEIDLTTLTADKDITTGGNYKITGESTTHRVKVTATDAVTITLDNAKIETQQSPLELCGAANVTLQLEGQNTLTCTADKVTAETDRTAGITVPEQATLTIDGAGKLAVQGGDGGAGIGTGAAFGYNGQASSGEKGGDLKSGRTYYTTLTGGVGGAGGQNGKNADKAGTVNIKNGDITTTGGTGGAGIGGGKGANGTNGQQGKTGQSVVYTDPNDNRRVTCVGLPGSGGAGGNGGTGGSCGTVTVENGKVIATGGSGSVGIGGGDGGTPGTGGSAIINHQVIQGISKSGFSSGRGENGYHKDGDGGTLTVTGGTVVADGEKGCGDNGCSGGAGIDSGTGNITVGQNGAVTGGSGGAGGASEQGNGGAGGNGGNGTTGNTTTSGKINAGGGGNGGNSEQGVGGAGGAGGNGIQGNAQNNGTIDAGNGGNGGNGVTAGAGGTSGQGVTGTATGAGTITTAVNGAVGMATGSMNNANTADSTNLLFVIIPCATAAFIAILALLKKHMS